MRQGTIYRLAILCVLLSCLFAPTPTQIKLPMQSALSHSDSITNRYLAPPAPPMWTIFHPWPLEQSSKSEFEALVKEHHRQFEEIEVQKIRFLEHSLRLAQLLPQTHLLGAHLQSGANDCRLGDCQIWFHINQKEN
ncbi:MAG: hypothetical protein VX026_10040 [Myxococcota bacterium]|nr:hypothetical protein [Myxococcota bacterium]